MRRSHAGTFSKAAKIQILIEIQKKVNAKSLLYGDFFVCRFLGSKYKKYEDLCI